MQRRYPAGYLFFFSIGPEVSEINSKFDTVTSSGLFYVRFDEYHLFFLDNLADDSSRVDAILLLGQVSYIQKSDQG
jgi:hypothetical protein